MKDQTSRIEAVKTPQIIKLLSTSLPIALFSSINPILNSTLPTSPPTSLLISYLSKTDRFLFANSRPSLLHPTEGSMASDNQEVSRAPSEAQIQVASDVAAVERTSISAAMDRTSEDHPNTITENGEKAFQKSEAQSSSGRQNFSDWNNWEKQLIVFIGSAAAVFSPLSANIYFPIFNVLATDLHVSNTLINLTVTVYMVSLPLLAESAE